MTVAPSLALGCLVTASLTTVAHAKATTAPPKTYDYQVTYDGATVSRLGAQGYSIVAITPSHSSDAVTWTMERK